MAAWIASAMAGVTPGFSTTAGAPPGPAGAAAPPEPGVTVTSYCTIAVPASEVAITVVRPGDTPIRNRLVGDAGWTRATPGSADITAAAGADRRSSTPVPACTVIGWLSIATGAGGAIGVAGAWAVGAAGNAGLCGIVAWA